MILAGRIISLLALLVCAATLGRIVRAMGARVAGRGSRHCLLSSIVLFSIVIMSGWMTPNGWGRRL
ncbi:hypothetical protein RAA17_03505 [Komagataeibacter rhaeticus]|nr:hypothetical protein [Komagataeibacter rhaeticus]